MTHPTLFSDQSDWAKLEPLFTALQDEALTSNNLAGWLRRWSDLQKQVWEARAGLKRSRLRDLTDVHAGKAFQAFYETVFIPFQAANQALTEKLLAAVRQPGFTGLETVSNQKQMLRLLQAEVELFRSENQPVLSAASTLVGEYERISGSIVVRMDGEEAGPEEMERRLSSPTRSTREAAFQAQSRAWLEQRPLIDSLFLRLLDLRRQLARNAGLPDYRAFRWMEMGRLDYSPEDSLGFHQAVQAEIIPLAQRLFEQRKTALNLSSIRTWDSVFDPQAVRSERPFADAAAFEEGMAPVFQRVDPQLGSLYTRMRAGYLDLGRRKGKPGGGEEWLFPVTGIPCLLSDADGSTEGVSLLLHEMGHAFNDYLILQQQGLFWDLDYPSEFAELAAISMTYLAAPSLVPGVFSPDQAAYLQRKSLTDVIMRWLPEIARVDAFQHWLYTEAPAVVQPEDLDAAWIEQTRRFMPWLDGTGVEDAVGAGWQRVRILFSQPFYQIEYGLAHLGALQIWRSAQQDPSAAWETYKAALALGGTRSLPELYAAAGARLAFDPAVIHHLAVFLEEYLDKRE